MLKIGMVVDNRYKILREIGRGGTSCVYLAENLRLHNYWAIKEVYRSRITENGAKANVLIAESNVLTRLNHSGLPKIVDILTTPESYLIVMEYIEGISLDKVLAQRGVCSQADVVNWGCQLCDVLHYLHSQSPSIIYRDMKPANVMLKPNGQIVLIDFGMAREFNHNNNHDTALLGTHGYAAPEQYGGNRQSDARTDIYSLGVTLYHLVTGHDPCLPPYGLQSLSAINSNLSPRLDCIIKKCTELKPDLRFQSAAELKYNLSASLSLQAPIVSRVQANVGEEKPKSYKWLWSLVSIPITLIIIIAIVFASGDNSSDDVGYYDGGYAYEDTVFNFEQEVTIIDPEEHEHYTLVPEVSGYYLFSSSSDDARPVVWVFDEDDNLIEKGNTTGEYEDFSFECWLEEGETYYIETTLYNLDYQIPSTGTYMIYVDYSE